MGCVPGEIKAIASTQDKHWAPTAVGSAVWALPPPTRSDGQEVGPSVAEAHHHPSKTVPVPRSPAPPHSPIMEMRMDGAAAADGGLLGAGGCYVGRYEAGCDVGPPTPASLPNQSDFHWCGGWITVPYGGSHCRSTAKR